MENAALDVLRAVSVTILNLFVIPCAGAALLAHIFPGLKKMLED